MPLQKACQQSLKTLLSLYLSTEVTVMVGNLDNRHKYRRKLPHWIPAKGTFFLTVNLYGAIPSSIFEGWRQEREQFSVEGESNGQGQRNSFLSLERYLHKRSTGPYWLENEQVAQLIYDAILFRNGKVYDLDCFTLMGNHMHLVFSLAKATEPSSFKRQSMAGIMHSLKTYTGRNANKILNRSGQFWQHESFDRWVRTPEEWRKVMNYVLDNPVKAGLVEDWRDWPWSWSRTANDETPGEEL